MTRAEQMQNRLNYLVENYKKERTIAEIIAGISDYVANKK